MRAILKLLDRIYDKVSWAIRLLEHILELLTLPKAVKFRIELENTMAKAHAATGVDFTVFENGQATATATPQDANHNTTTLADGLVPVWTVSDPSVILSPSADGLSCLLTAGTTPVTGATVTATATPADGSAPIVGTSDPFDVIAQPPGSAVSFKIALS